MLTQNGCDATSNATDTAWSPARNEPRSDPNVPLENLGAAMFFDAALSVNSDQACASCHGPEVGYTGPQLLSNLSGGIYEGSIHGRFGNRRAPSSAYNTFAPIFSYVDEQFIGGSFWDGRATGWRLGDAAAEQAQGPFLNPVEQALADGATVVDRVCHSPYAFAFEWRWGVQACLNADLGYDAIAASIAAFETSLVSSRFDSKYDAYLRGNATLSTLEQQGLALFDGKAECSECHVLEQTLDVDLIGPLFTDFTYDNVGVPRNLSNPFYRMDGVMVGGQAINPLGFGWVDQGLGGHIAGLAADDGWRSLPYVPAEMLQLAAEDLAALAQASKGKHKVPSLRNVDLRPFPGFDKSYMHNGYFKTLAGIVHFYNTRDVLPVCDDDFPEAVALALECWPLPEVVETVNHGELGDLGLSPVEETAVVAFLGTLSDGFMVE